MTFFFFGFYILTTIRVLARVQDHALFSPPFFFVPWLGTFYLHRFCIGCLCRISIWVVEYVVRRSLSFFPRSCTIRASPVFCVFCLARALLFFSPIPLAPLPFVNHSPSVRFKGPSELRFGLSTGRWPSGSVAVGILPAIRFVASGLPWSSSDSDSLSDSYCHPLRALTLAGAELFR